MQRDRFTVARTWLANAARDRRAALILLDSEPALAAFHAQQVAEKALKAATIALTDDHLRTHATSLLLRELREVAAIPEDVAADALALDLYYASARYPDAVSDDDPGEVVQRSDAQLALGRAERVLEFARTTLALAEASAE